MDNIKKFEDFLDRMQGLLDNAKKQGHIIVRVEDLENTFPELKESEDERIRKNLIELFHDTVSNDEIFSDYGLDKTEVLAWLEKQGEQEEPQVYETEDGEVITYSESEGYKVVKPKFHEGDWITNGDYTWKIVEVKPLDYILQAQDGNIVDDTISHVDEQFHSFTIEDAKDGDVLASELCDSIILFKGINDDNNIDFYCDYDFSEIDLPGDRFSVNNGQHYGNVEDSKDFHPATKEQRDTLKKAITDAGYTFDFEKKELKKLGQPEVTKTSDQEEIAEIPFGAKDSELQEATYFIPKGFHAEIDDDKVVIKKGEKPAAWSEEDEKKRSLLISILEVNHPNGYFKVNPANTLNMEAMHTEELVSWLKSLRPQNTWKPSDEQMKVLLSEVEAWTKGCPKQIVLESLYNDLKKLKG